MYCDVPLQPPRETTPQDQVTMTRMWLATRLHVATFVYIADVSPPSLLMRGHVTPPPLRSPDKRHSLWRAFRRYVMSFDMRAEDPRK